MVDIFYYENEGKKYPFKGLVIDEEQMRVISNPKRIKILELLIKKGLLSGEEIASLMNEDVFSIYYHLRKLEESGLIHIKERIHVRNFEEKKYSFNVDALVLFLNRDFETKSFIRDQDSAFKGVIVVGSPDAHGKFNLRARDGYLAGILSHFLGNMGWDIDVALDTLFDKEEYESKNYIFVIGGPLTNMTTYELNKRMKVYYDEKMHYRSIRSEITKNQYNEENIALIGKIKMNDLWYVLLSGINIVSTELSINAFKSLYNEIINSEEEQYFVIEGIDKDSDGRIEHYEILERYP